MAISVGWIVGGSRIESNIMSTKGSTRPVNALRSWFRQSGSQK